MLGDGIILQQVLLAAMDTTCLHPSKLPRPLRMWQSPPPTLAAMVTGQTSSVVQVCYD
jgi:hypothetical protein